MHLGQNFLTSCTCIEYIDEHKSFINLLILVNPSDIDIQMQNSEKQYIYLVSEAKRMLIKYINIIITSG